MSQFSRTWWGQKFIAVMEKVGDEGRLSRGRSYARGNKVKSFQIQDGGVTAQVRGSVNPYFGVYKEPLYHITLEFQPISAAKWSAAIALMASKASIISRLLLKEIPDNIEETFAQLNLNFLPSTHKDFHATCSCPDWGDPCKHIAGVYYLLAAELDHDPFLLFELRGLSRDDLLKELAKSPLGETLSAELQLEARSPQVVASYYPPLQTVKTEMCQNLREFWHGTKRLPQTIDAPPQVPISGIPIKKQGDFPPFWQRDHSFIEVMETLYDQVKTKGQL
ncbi:MAG: hypothetical protein GVY04_04605 [Cyanobacteria bacterium]|jgi:uncharacterized Zn finger protein|nr:hypothetical protein [Cyanobacteria bacterium GSL.Bin1]